MSTISFLRFSSIYQWKKFPIMFFSSSKFNFNTTEFVLFIWNYFDAFSNFFLFFRFNLFDQAWNNKQQRCYTENEVINMLEVLIETIFVEIGGHIFQQIICIPIGKSVPLYTWHSFPYVVNFIDWQNAINDSGLVYGKLHFEQYFSYIMAVRFIDVFPFIQLLKIRYFHLSNF